MSRWLRTAMMVTCDNPTRKSRQKPAYKLLRYTRHRILVGLWSLANAQVAENSYVVSRHEKTCNVLSHHCGETFPNYYDKEKSSKTGTQTYSAVYEASYISMFVENV